MLATITGFPGHVIVGTILTCSRLVEDDKRSITNGGARNAQSAFHASGKAGAVLILLYGKINALQPFLDDGRSLISWHATKTSKELQVFLRAQIWVQIVILLADTHKLANSKGILSDGVSIN